VPFNVPAAAMLISHVERFFGCPILLGYGWCGLWEGDSNYGDRSREIT
jgi:hypothetical protein